MDSKTLAMVGSSFSPLLLSCAVSLHVLDTLSYNVIMFTFNSHECLKNLGSEGQSVTCLPLSLPLFGF